MKLTKKLIKSHIPNGYRDGSKLNGILLEHGSYDLFEKVRGEEYIFRTNSSNPLIKILRETFEVKYVRPWWGHYDEYTIRLK
jgi:hypothetical protein